MGARALSSRASAATTSWGIAPRSETACSSPPVPSATPRSGPSGLGVKSGSQAPQRIRADWPCSSQKRRTSVVLPTPASPPTSRTCPRDPRPTASRQPASIDSSGARSSRTPDAPAPVPSATDGIAHHGAPNYDSDSIAILNARCARRSGALSTDRDLVLSPARPSGTEFLTENDSTTHGPQAYSRTVSARFWGREQHGPTTDQRTDDSPRATDLAVGGSSPSRRATKTAAQRPCYRFVVVVWGPVGRVDFPPRLLRLPAGPVDDTCGNLIQIASQGKVTAHTMGGSSGRSTVNRFTALAGTASVHVSCPSIGRGRHPWRDNKTGPSWKLGRSPVFGSPHVRCTNHHGRP